MNATLEAKGVNWKDQSPLPAIFTSGKERTVTKA